MQNLKRPLFAVMLGSGLTIALVAAGEITFRSRPDFRARFPEKGVVFSDDFNRELESGLDSKSDWLIPRLPASNQIKNSKQRKLSITGAPYFRFSPGIGGFFPFPFAKSKVKAIDPFNNQVVYSIQYEFDRYGLRIIPAKHRPHRAIFLGCSFTLGDGVESHQTLAAQFQEAQTEFSSEILAFHAWSPTVLIRRIEQPPKLQPSAVGNSDIAIYTFIDHHLLRTVGGSDLARKRNWLAGLNAYSSEGKFEGDFASARPLQFWTYKMYGRLLDWSILARRILPEIPIYNLLHVEQLVNIIDHLRASVQSNLNIKDFRVLIFPNSRVGRVLATRLQERGISFINWGHIDLREYLNNPSLPDGHPSPETYRVMAAELKRELASKRKRE